MPMHLPGARRGRRILSSGLALALLCAAATSLRAGGSLAELDQDNGLPDAQLGAPLKNFPGLVKTEDTGRWLSFSRPSDKLDFNRVGLKNITYNFFKEQLYSIQIGVDGFNNIRRLIKVLEDRYGKDHTFATQNYATVRAVMEVREWSAARVYCVLKNGDDYHGGVLTFIDKPLWDQLEAPRRQKEDEARAMLKGSFSNGDF